MMVLSEFNFLQEDTRIIKHQNVAYKLKIIYKNCDQETLPSFTADESHEELEQTFRAILYADQRNQNMSKIKTKHFLISVQKKQWRRASSFVFRKDDADIKCYEYMFVLTVNLRDGPASDDDQEVNKVSNKTATCRKSYENENGCMKSDKKAQNQSRSRSRSRKRLDQYAQIKDCKVVIKRLRKQSENQKPTNCENDMNSDSDIEDNSDHPDSDGYTPSDESIDMVKLDEKDSDIEDKNQTKAERKSPRKKTWRKFYVPKYKKNPETVSDISSDSDSDLSDTNDVEMSDGSFRPVESTERRRRKSNKKRTSPRKKDHISYKEVEENSDISETSSSSDSEDEQQVKERVSRSGRKNLERDTDEKKGNRRKQDRKSDTGKKMIVVDENLKDNSKQDMDDMSSEEDSVTNRGNVEGRKRISIRSKQGRKFRKQPIQKRKTISEDIDSDMSITDVKSDRSLKTLKSTEKRRRILTKARNRTSSRKKDRVSYREVQENSDVSETNSSSDSEGEQRTKVKERICRSGRKIVQRDQVENKKNGGKQGRKSETGKKLVVVVEKLKDGSEQDKENVSSEEDSVTVRGKIEKGKPIPITSMKRMKSRKQPVQKKKTVSEDIDSDSYSDEYLSDDGEEEVDDGDKTDDYVPSSDDNADTLSDKTSDEEMSDVYMPLKQKSKQPSNTKRNQKEVLTNSNKEKKKGNTNRTEKDTKEKNGKTRVTRKKKMVLLDENTNVDNILGSAKKRNENLDQSANMRPRRSRKLFSAAVLPLAELPSTLDNVSKEKTTRKSVRSPAARSNDIGETNMDTSVRLLRLSPEVSKSLRSTDKTTRKSVRSPLARSNGRGETNMDTSVRLLRLSPEVSKSLHSSDKTTRKSVGSPTVKSNDRSETNMDISVRLLRLSPELSKSLHNTERQSIYVASPRNEPRSAKRNSLQIDSHVEESARNTRSSPRVSKSDIEPRETDRLNRMRVRSHSEGRNVKLMSKDRYLVEQEELEETMKLQNLSKSDPPPQRMSPRKRKSSGMWDLVDTILTPIKRLVTK